MHRISKATAEAILDFSGGHESLQGLAVQQMRGAVALYNKLADHRVAYLADEVGMGKTYIGLGVSTLMRHFNAGARVLYLLPKNNVRDKWVKDYHAFIHSNYRLRDMTVKGLGDQPVTPFKVCHNLPEFVQTVASGNERDLFLCTSVFSFAMGNTVAQVLSSTRHFQELMPQYGDLMAPLVRRLKEKSGNAKPGGLKQEVKLVWMQALSEMLPRFDLVIVDEAHNLRAGRHSSDRNNLLATLLKDRCRIKRLLLLSATPYDRHLDHLRNQVTLFGFDENAALPQGGDPAVPEMHQALSRLLVRRLNTLTLADVPHTRNMYRREHRSGERAEVKMTVAQKLFAALLQKKVSEHLQENCSNRFELGMLASFESYLPGDKSKPVEFDGQEVANDADVARDAADRGIVEYLVNDYERTFSARPPHPKMDSVSQHTHRLAFVEGKKQLIFVRRVRSVSELKFKLEEAYDQWIGDYISADEGVAQHWRQYRARPVSRSHSLIEQDADESDDLPSSSDNFFTWFYRGKNMELEGRSLGPSPSNFRTTLLQSRIFETDWTSLPGMPSVASLDIDWSVVPKETTAAHAAQRYRLAQFAYLRTVAQREDAAATVAKRALEVLYEDITPVGDVSDPSLARELSRSTLWTGLRAHSALAELAPSWGQGLFIALAESDHAAVDRLLRRIATHHELLGALCRVDHPFIDLYGLRDVRRGNTGDADGALIDAFVELLDRQRRERHTFCTYQILRDTVDNLDLLIKLNFPLVYQKSVSDFTHYLSTQLRSTSPIRGATGENSASRTVIATLFRMPGYPRVLVSTDVFQEGEDLHTFCDSVVHYGISSSPIALEQKVGRVDRIGSLAHRNMQSAGTAYAEHFIQVGFPHIRQSLEFYQVRQAAANMNRFIETLHAVGQRQAAYSSELVVHEALADQAPVPAQILGFLTSHYEIVDSDLHGADHRQTIHETRVALDRRLAHVKAQMDASLKVLSGSAQACVRETGTGWHDSGADLGGVAITVRSAVGMAGLLVVEAVRPCDVEELEDIRSPTQRVRAIRRLQADPFRRIALGPAADKSRRRVLKLNAQNYVGSQGTSVSEEIIDAWQRVSESGRAAGKRSPEITQQVHALIEGLDHENERMSVRRLSTWRLQFHFKLEERYQLVRWGFQGHYIVFSSRVLDRVATRRLAKADTFLQAPLLKHTLERNQHFDVVDFYIDEDEGLSVRTCHLARHLDHQKVMSLAFQVASQADRLEHVLKGQVDEE